MKGMKLKSKQSQVSRLNGPLISLLCLLMSGISTSAWCQENALAVNHPTSQTLPNADWPRPHRYPEQAQPSSLQIAATDDKEIHHSGALTTDSPRMWDGRAYEIYQFEGKAGYHLLLELRSSDFDTHVRLESEEHGYIAANDNAGTYEANLSLKDHTTDSFLRVSLPYDGTYSIFVLTNQAGEIGNYQLALRQSERTSSPLLSEVDQAITNAQRAGGQGSLNIDPRMGSYAFDVAYRAAREFLTDGNFIDSQFTFSRAVLIAGDNRVDNNRPGNRDISRIQSRASIADQLSGIAQRRIRNKKFAEGEVILQKVRELKSSLFFDQDTHY